MENKKWIEYNRTCYNRKKEKGVCVCCGKEKPIPGKTRCEKCAEKNRLNSLHTARRRRLMGLCLYCGKNEKREGKSCCAECAERMRNYTASWRAAHG